MLFFYVEGFDIMYHTMLICYQSNKEKKRGYYIYYFLFSFIISLNVLMYLFKENYYFILGCKIHSCYHDYCIHLIMKFLFFLWHDSCHYLFSWILILTKITLRTAQVENMGKLDMWYLTYRKTVNEIIIIIIMSCR